MDTDTDRNALKCILMCHFHDRVGPKILCQVPPNYMSQETFHVVRVYILPKGEINKNIITITTKDFKILGYPMKIRGSKYIRNLYYYNLCFVFDSKYNTIQYEPILKKLNFFLTNLEMEERFLSNSDIKDETQENSLLSSLLEKVMVDLNMYKKCVLTARGTVVYLNVIEVSPNPPTPMDFDVPIVVSSLNHDDEHWDLTTRQVAQFIDGVNHISRIAELSKLDLEMVTACVQNLVYCNIVSLVDIFRYSNMYVCTTKIRELAQNKNQYQEAINSISREGGQKATMRDIFMMFSAMRQGSRMIDICLRFNPASLNINERNLVLYGLSNGYIRQLRKYPVVLEEDDVEKVYMGQYYNGLNSLGLVSCYTETDEHKLDELIEKSTKTVSIWK